MKAVRDRAALPAGLVALAAVTALLLAPAPKHAVDQAGAGPTGKNPAVSLESIPGSRVKRVTLAARAAERLGIETGRVSEESIVRRQIVSGLVVNPPASQPPPKQAAGAFAGFAQPPPGRSTTPVAAGQSVFAAAPSPAAGEAWVLVTLSQGEWDRLAKDKPARVLPLVTGDRQGRAILALPSGMPPIEDAKRSMLTVYYRVSGKDHGLTPSKRMRVQLQLMGSEERQKVVPYSAVYYDAQGTAWVYVNAKPLVFERQRVGVERVVGDLAVLTDGPLVGVPVVTVGAPLLFGAEIFGK